MGSPGSCPIAVRGVNRGASAGPEVGFSGEREADPGLGRSRRRFGLGSGPRRPRPRSPPRRAAALPGRSERAPGFRPHRLGPGRGPRALGGGARTGVAAPARLALRGLRGSPHPRRPLLHDPPQRLRGRAALPAHGPEPVAGPRPRPGEGRGPRRLAGILGGAHRAPLRQPATRRQALPRAQRGSSRAAGAPLRGGGPLGLRGSDGAAGGRPGPPGAEPRARPDRERGSGALGLGGHGRAPGGVLLLPPLHRGALRSGPRREPRPTLGGAGAGGGGGGGAPGFRPPLAAREDDPGRGCPRPLGTPPAAGPFPRRLPGGGGGHGRGLPRLLSAYLRPPHAPGHLWGGRSRGAGHLAAARGGGPPAGPFLRPPALRARLPARPPRDRPARAAAVAAVSPPGSPRGGGAGPRPGMADVVGGAMPAGSPARAPGPVPRAGARPPRRGSSPGPPPLAMAPPLVGARAGRIHDRGADAAPPAQPGESPHAGVGRPVRGVAGRPLPSLPDRRRWGGGPGGSPLGRGHRRSHPARPAGAGEGRHRPPLPRPGAAPPAGPDGGSTGGWVGASGVGAGGGGSPPPPRRQGRRGGRPRPVSSTVAGASGPCRGWARRSRA
jgi:hypothetical protein